MKNLISIRARNITNKLKKLLEELSENIENNLNGNGNNGGGERIPIPIRVPVNSRNNLINNKNQRRYYSTNFNFNFNRGFNLNCNTFKGRNFKSCKFNFINSTRNYSSSYLYQKYQLNWFKFYQTNKNSIIFNNFSTKYQSWYRFKLHNFYKYPSLISILKNNNNGLHLQEQNNKRLNQPLLKKNNIENDNDNINIRTNISLSSKFNNFLINLSNNNPQLNELNNLHEFPKSCYLDFSININLLIPSSTILNKDILNEILINISNFEKKINQIKIDINKLSDLGELPIIYKSNDNLIRVVFKNCDVNKLNNLLIEKNITSGVIVEDEEYQPGSINENDIFYNNINELDILSNLNSSNSLSSFNEHDENLLSSSNSVTSETSEENNDFLYQSDLKLINSNLNVNSIENSIIENLNINQINENNNNLVHINGNDSYYSDEFYWT